MLRAPRSGARAIVGYEYRAVTPPTASQKVRSGVHKRRCPASYRRRGRSVCPAVSTRSRSTSRPDCCLTAPTATQPLPEQKTPFSLPPGMRWSVPSSDRRSSSRRRRRRRSDRPRCSWRSTRVSRQAVRRTLRRVGGSGPRCANCSRSSTPRRVERLRATTARRLCRPPCRRPVRSMRCPSALPRLPPQVRNRLQRPVPSVPALGEADVAGRAPTAKQTAGEGQETAFRYLIWPGG